MDNSNEYRQLSVKDFEKELESDKKFYLIDVLPNEHFKKIHLPNALNACVFEVTFLEQVEAIVQAKDANIVLYGSSEKSMDTIKAADKLHERGYKNINILQGGLEAWRIWDLPLAGYGVDQSDDPKTLLKLEDRSFQVDTTQSRIEWIGRNTNSSHFGAVRIAAGEIIVKDGSIIGNFDIDMDAITTKDLEGNELEPVLLAHLKSDDFFLTKLFPMAKFKIINSKPIEKPFLTSQNYEINGILQLRGVSAKQDFMATVTRTDEGALSLEAHFDIDRTKWNIVYGSTRFFEHLGKHLVFDLIGIQVRIIAF